jgi:cytochrome bd-type quinol oxidase subunit 2
MLRCGQERPPAGEIMDTLFSLLRPAALAAVLVILALGLWNMMRGGGSNRSQRLMRMRVLFQFIALVVVMAALYISGRN